MTSPIVDSLWTRCLFEVIKKAQKEGKKTVEFKDVDTLVLEKSQEEITNEFSDRSP